MRILFSSPVDMEYETHRDLENAIDFAEVAGIKITYVFEGFQAIAKRGMHKYDVALLSGNEAIHYQPTWEKYFDTCVVMFDDRVEMRYYEQLNEDGTKYMIHTEPFKLPNGMTLNDEHFLTGFFKTLAVDQIDARKAVQMGIKWSISPQSVVW